MMFRNLGIALVLAVMAIGLHQLLLYRAREAAVTVERARVSAVANQQIAQRRETDADFDRMDAMALCKEAGLRWTAVDGRSYCVAD